MIKNTKTLGNTDDSKVGIHAIREKINMYDEPPTQNISLHEFH